ncbi:hypothetical protein DL764_009393 [Monosporascus ibericus]|uniref:Uncharacterized protein n=1 Tax=Monosporascus ibericus TaxID=155417 RepID=A0A4Q4SV13_9PEZI|nr:hypothetical protein DL764_009393 [Monosporascus ibericus]
MVSISPYLNGANSTSPAQAVHRMAIFHVPYHVWVKDYHWTARDLNVRVQSPVISLGNTVSPPVFRQLEGNNKNEPRVAETADELMDDVGEPEYATEAHGVFVPRKPRGRHLPLWVPYQQSSAAVKEGEIAFVDLGSNTTRTGSIARVCWVPDRRSPAGKLYTIISGVRVWKRGRETISNTLVCVQEEGSPEEAKLIQVPSAELSEFTHISPLEKRRLFDLHLNLIRANHTQLSPVKRQVFGLAKSTNSLDNGWRAMHSILDENVPNTARSRRSVNRELLEVDEDCDDDLEYGTSPMTVRSRHLQQSTDCRTSHSPLECVISPNERHEHCESLRLSVEPHQSINMMFDLPEAARGFRSVGSPLQYVPYPTPESSPPAQPTPFLLDTIQLELAPLPKPDYEFMSMRETHLASARRPSSPGRPGTTRAHLGFMIISVSAFLGSHGAHCGLFEPLAVAYITAADVGGGKESSGVLH